MTLNLYGNTNIKLSTILLVFFMFHVGLISAQDKITIDDYNRAVGFMYENRNNKKVFNAHIQPNWFSDSTGVWYINHSPDNKRYLKVTFPDQVQSDLFDHQKLSLILSDSLDTDVKANDLPISRIDYKSPTELKITAKGKTFLLNTVTNLLNTVPKSEETNKNEKASPDNKWVAYTKDYNLYIKSTETDEVKQLSKSGKKGYEYATWYGWADLMEGENSDRPEKFNVRWSEDNEWIYANICDMRSAQKMYLLDWSVDSLYRPRLLSYYRGSPGDTSMIYEKPVFFNVKTGNEIQPDLPRSTHINNISVRSSITPGRVYLENMTRGYQKVNIHTFDLNAEKLQTIYTESSNTNIDNFTYELAEESGYIFFLSEKNGWRQLYSLNLKTKEERLLTQGEYYINSIARIDEKDQRIYFLASGSEEGRNPYYQHLYSISFNGKKLELLTNEDRHQRPPHSEIRNQGKHSWS